MTADADDDGVKDASVDPPADFVLAVRASAAQVISAAAERVVVAASSATSARGRFILALSGGSTPRALYALLATPDYAARIDWSRVHLFWGDERCLPPEHPDSNYRMTRESLLDHVAIPSQNVHRVQGEIAPDEAARAYENELRALFAETKGTPAVCRFDMVLLGMGADGHTASLFPGLSAVRETGRWVVAEYVPVMAMSRVTLTPAALNAAAEIVLLVVGADKSATLRRVIEGPHDPITLPVQAVRPGDAGQVTWLVDGAAASLLTPR